MINISNKKDCCGCHACVQCCPKQCISLHEDNEGFLYPKVSLGDCIDCHLCEKVCPVINPQETAKPVAVYAAKNAIVQEQIESSSGGLFLALAKTIIDKGGVVFGVVFDDDFHGAHHAFTDTIEGLNPMMRSKYVQSKVGGSFQECESFLKQGKHVLYTGTPCQIKALKLFLRKEYENLVTTDIICHGVPSPKVWRRYLDEGFKGTIIENINFRNKHIGDWRRYGFSLQLKGIKKEVHYRYKSNPYMLGYIGNLFLRPSCYSCPAKNGTSTSDITIADYWGIKSVMPDFYDANGVGLLIVNTKKGQSIVDQTKLIKAESTLEDALKNNSSYYKSASIPENRGFFWSSFEKGDTEYETIISSCLPNSGSNAIRGINRVKHSLSRIIRKVIKK